MRLSILGAIALAILPGAALAQTGTSVQFPSGYAPSTSICVKQGDGKCVPVSADNPLPISGGTSGSGGGGGDASAANQTELNRRIGDTVASPAAFTLQARLEGIRSLLAAPLTVAPHAVTQPDAYATGSIALGTANAPYTVSPANGAGTASFVVTGLSGSGAVLSVEASNDGTNWVAVNAILAGGGNSVATISADGQFRVNASARRGIRLRVSTTGTGTATVSSTVSVAAWDALTPQLDGNRDYRVPTVTVTPFVVSLPANASTEILAALSTRVSFELQCAATADIGVSSTHAALTSAVPGTSNLVDLVIKSGNTAVYIPAYVSGLGITAYTGTAQVCWGKSYARQ